MQNCTAYVTAFSRDKRTDITTESLKLSKEADIDSYRQILLLTFFSRVSGLNNQSEERLCNFPLSETSYTRLVLRETNLHVITQILLCMVPPINVSKENTFALDSLLNKKLPLSNI